MRTSELDSDRQQIARLSQPVCLKTVEKCLSVATKIYKSTHDEGQKYILRKVIAEIAVVHTAARRA
jgi:hypothetical protein